MPPLDKSRNHRISLSEAADYTRRHREANRNQTGRLDSGAFVAGQVQELLAQSGCAGVRIYNGRGADQSAHFVLVGVDENGNDMTQGTILQQMMPCPPFCPPTDSALNA